MDLYLKLNDCLKKGIPCMTITVVKKTGEGPLDVGKKMLVTETGEAIGTVGGGAIEYEAREYCKQLIQEGKSDLKRYVLSEGKVLEDAETLPMACGGTATLFFEYIGVKAYVYIFGAGHVGQALARVLRTLGYHMTVIDEREEVIEGFRYADRKVHQSFVDFIDEEGLRDNSYVIVCTPSHKYDYNVLHKIQEKKYKLKYMGMLCSKIKLEDYLSKTYDAFGGDIDLRNFYSPIGLDTGGGSPEEIAVSIAAEMLTIMYDKQGHNHMRGDY